MKKAAAIPWNEIGEKYAALFSCTKGMPAKPLRTAPGSLIIQKQYEYSDRELVEQICENPYYQFFIGLPGYQDKEPFVPSRLVEFRKHLTDDILGDINEMIIAYNTPEDDPLMGYSGGEAESGGTDAGNKGTPDAGCHMCAAADSVSTGHQSPE